MPPPSAKKPRGLPKDDRDYQDASEARHYANSADILAHVMDFLPIADLFRMAFCSKSTLALVTYEQAVRAFVWPAQGNALR
jgi:hypothetical protein